MDTPILFSIVVPVYNAKTYLPFCVQSIVNQTYSHWELLLVDDGSVDESAAMCDDYARNDPRIQAFHKENGGQLSAREFGVRRAGGQYILFLDADDTFTLNTFEILAELIQQYPCDCVIFDFRMFRSDDELPKLSEPGFSAELTQNKAEIYKRIFCAINSYSMCRKAIKATVFDGRDHSAFYRLRLAEDLIQSIEVIGNSQQVLFTDASLYHYRSNPQSVTHTATAEKFIIDFSAYEYLHAFLEEENVFSDAEFAEYRGFYIRVLMELVWSIASSARSYIEKKRLFQEITDTAYYQNVLAAADYNKDWAGNKGWLFPAFQRGWFWFITSLAQLQKSLKKKG